MTLHLCAFSDASMSRSRALCIESALKHGIDSIAGPHYFDPALETRDGFTLEWLKSQPIYEQMGADWWTQRGIGYWLWKPYIIDQVMSKVPDGDFLVYADAGVEFINNIRYIIDRMDQDVWLFGNNWEHAHWCKRDVIESVWPNRLETQGGEAGGHFNLWRHFGKQAQASVIVTRVSEWSRNFVRVWGTYCGMKLIDTNHPDLAVCDCDACVEAHAHALIDDSPSRRPNHPEFREHRHDQAILTTLAYREGIKLHYWPTTYNFGAFNYEKLPEYAGDDYPILFHHHRRRDHEWDLSLLRYQFPALKI